MSSIKMLFLFCLILFASCSNNDDKKEGEYKISNKEIKLYPNSNIASRSGSHNYMFIDKGEKGNSQCFIMLSGYWMQGIYGKVHRLPDAVFQWEIPDEGLNIIIEGTAEQSSHGYNLIPEIKSVEFYCTSLKLKTHE
ncbi:MAG: hypothetical protein LBT43_11295 [Prevotella sp.]|jgi:hypothetical protein|nr:hypothetical protein [Prevotella sp.]